MKLYFSPGACSLSPHIVAQEAGIPLEIEKVDGGTKKTASGKDFWAINPKGYVPALELDGGEILTEGPAIVQYLADMKPESKLVPPNGTLERYRQQELLGFINSEIHKTYSPLFNPKTTPENREERITYLKKRYGTVEKALEGKTFLMGDQFTAADAYLYVVTNWAGFQKVDLSEFPNVMAHHKRVGERPGVKAAIDAEKGKKS